MNHEETLRRIFITSKSRPSTGKWKLLVAPHASKKFKQLQMNTLLQNAWSEEARVTTSQRKCISRYFGYWFPMGSEAGVLELEPAACKLQKILGELGT